MKKVLIIYAVSKDEPSVRGIVEKMEGIAQGFGSNRHETDLVYLSDKGLLYKDKVQENRHSKRLNRILFFKDAVKILEKQPQYDVLYIRYSPISPYFTHLMQRAKALHPTIKIVVEMPTYPYRQELTSSKKWINQVLSKSYSQWPKLVDLVVCPEKQMDIHGVKVLEVSNGIDVTKIRKKDSIPESSQAIHMVCVTRLWAWQGLEQFIIEWARFTANHPEMLPEMTLTIVGEGPEVNKLKNVIQQLELEEKVFFLGSKFGEELDEIFEKADLGIGVISDPVRDLKKVSALKHRLYAAKGLPFVYGIEDDDFSKVKGTHLLEKEIKIARMIKWYQEEIYPEYLQTSKELRAHAEEKLSWATRMERIIKELF